MKVAKFALYIFIITKQIDSVWKLVLTSLQARTGNGSRLQVQLFFQMMILVIRGEKWPCMITLETITILCVGLNLKKVL